jgi:enamine deaminase RidA (YjgF/YER057c/UK114 family)
MQRSPAFAQAMIAPAGRTLYVGGQNGIDGSGALLDGLRAQTEQALRNVLTILEAAGTDADHVVKLSIFLAAGEDPTEGYAAAASVWGAHRTAITVVGVQPLRPNVLVEIDAVATIPD